MALIKCPECEREISDRAKVCIHCGYPMSEHFEQVQVCPPSTATIDLMNQQEIEKYNMLGDDLLADKKYLAALDYYIKAANLGSAYAQVRVGNIYSRGLGVEVNHSEAAKWFHLAAEQDYADALCNLALAYKNGDGLEKDLQKAIALNLRAIKKGSAVAAGNLGTLYEYAPDGIQSYQLARKYYEDAISLGTTQYSVYNNLALIYAEGKGISTNPTKAEQYFLKAIELGSEQARKSYPVFANNWGVMYADGEGVEKNYTKAEAYYLKAIELGNEYAKNNYAILANNLGVMYSNGKGVEQSYAKAEAYYLKAIELGYEEAKENYGIFANNRGVAYADGKGVERNYAKAEQYYLIAIKYGSQRAISNYEILKKQKWQYAFLEREERKAREKQEWQERLTRTCPRCGRHAGHPLNEFEKKVSISFWGYASNKWGKSYKCDACDYMW